MFERFTETSSIACWDHPFVIFFTSLDITWKYTNRNTGNSSTCSWYM